MEAIRFGDSIDDFRRFDSFRFEGIDIDRKFVDLAQSGIDVFKLGVIGVEGIFIAHHMQHDLGHAGRLAVFGSLENHVLHLSAAKALCALFAEYPGNGVGNVGLSAAVRADDSGYPVAGKDDFRVICKGFEACYLKALKLEHLVENAGLGQPIFCGLTQH
jgi:hypothetical protein